MSEENKSMLMQIERGKLVDRATYIAQLLRDAKMNEAETEAYILSSRINDFIEKYFDE